MYHLRYLALGPPSLVRPQPTTVMVSPVRSAPARLLMQMGWMVGLPHTNVKIIYCHTLAHL